MFFFNLLVLSIDFHFWFWLLLSKRTHLKGSSKKKGILTENLRGRDGGGVDADEPHPHPAT